MPQHTGVSLVGVDEIEFSHFEVRSKSHQSAGEINDRFSPPGWGRQRKFKKRYTLIQSISEISSAGSNSHVAVPVSQTICKITDMPLNSSGEHLIG
jgi:hypothetical protein